jgi:preprotein translocase subunit SecD
MARGPRPLLRPARGLLLLAFVLLLAAGCGSSRRNCNEVVLRAVPNNGQQITAADMKTAQQIIEQRVNKLGVTSPAVTVHGDEIVIQYAGLRHPATVADISDMTGQLQIFDFEPSLEPPTVTGNQQPAPMPSLYSLLSAVKSRADNGSPQAYYLFKTFKKKSKTLHEVVQGPAPTREQLLSPYKGKQPARTVVLKVPANTEAVRCRVTTSCPGAGSNGTSTSGMYWYLFKYFSERKDGPPQLTGRDLVNSGITADIDPNTGRPIVTLQLAPHGAKEFARITKAEYNRGRVNAGEAGQLGTTNQTMINQYAGHNAIVLDGQLEETPYIDYTDASLSDGIVGSAQIREPTTQVAKRTALVLQSGSLPYAFEQVKLSDCAR